MKLSLVFLVALAACGSVTAFNIPDQHLSENNNRKLIDDLIEFRNLIPKDKINILIRQYLNQDAEFQEFVKYLLSDEIKQMILEIEHIQEIQHFFKYLNDAGVDIYMLLNAIHLALEMEPYKPASRIQMKISGGLSGFFEDFVALLPDDELQALYDKKLETSQAFRDFIEYLKSSEFRTAVYKIFGNQRVRNFVQYLTKRNTDVHNVIVFLGSLVGIHYKPSYTRSLTKTLGDEFKEFRDLVPLDEITSVVFEYFQHDAEFQDFVEYLLTDDTKKMITELEHIQEIKYFLKYLHDRDVNIYEMVDKLHGLLGMEPFRPQYRSYMKMTGGLSGFFKDIRLLLPVDKLQALYDKKLETSHAFRDFVEYLKSSEFQTTVDKVLSNERVGHFMEYLKERNVDIKTVADFLGNLLGLQFKPFSKLSLIKNLGDDLREFRDLIPMHEVKTVFMKYLEQDTEFQEFVEYLMSDEMKNMVREVEHMQGVQHLLKYLNDAGVDVHTMLNKMHQALGMEPYKPQFRIQMKMTGGLSGFFKDLEALMPTDKLKALYEKKLQTSKTFHEFIEYLKSSQFHMTVNNVLANQKVRHLISYLKERNVHVEKVADLLSNLLGIHFKPSFKLSLMKNLGDDLREFRDLIPMNKVKTVFMKYLEQDTEFQEFVEYLMSDEMKNMVREVEHMQGVKHFFKYLDDAGVDVYMMLNKMHQALGMEPYQPPFRIQMKITGGLSGFFKDLEALMPTDKLKALYEKKLQTSKAFHEFVEYLKSSQFHKTVNNVLANQRVRNLISYLKERNVHVEKAADLLSNLLGIHFKPSFKLSLIKNLGDDLREFRDLIPMNKVKTVFMKYFSYDVKFQEFVKYLMSDEMKNMIHEVEHMQGVQHFFKYLNDAGVDVYMVLNKMHQVLGMEPYQPQFRIQMKITGGLSGFFKDLEALMPLDKLKALYEKKLQTSEAFREFIEYMKSSQFQMTVNNVLANHRVRNLISYLKERNVNVNKVVDIVNHLLGFQLEPSF